MALDGTRWRSEGRKERDRIGGARCGAMRRSDLVWRHEVRSAGDWDLPRRTGLNVPPPSQTPTFSGNGGPRSVFHLPTLTIPLTKIMDFLYRAVVLFHLLSTGGGGPEETGPLGSGSGEVG